MAIRRTSALVEAGLLAAMAALFTIVGNYVPFLYALANFFWPLSLIICGRRHGLKWSILCLLVSCILIAMFLNPMEALVKLVTVSFAGITIGECMRRKIEPTKTILLGSVATLISLVAGFAVTFFVMNINPITQLADLFQESVSMSKDIFKQFNLPPEAEAQLDNFPKMAMLLLPACMVMGAPFSTAIDYFLARKVLGRLGDYYPPFPPFSTWRMPKLMLVPYGIALIGLWMSHGQQDTILYKVSVNVFYCMCLTLVLETICLLRWYIVEKNKPKIWFGLGVFLLLTNPLISQLGIIAGAYDLIFDFRTRYGSRK